MFFMKNSSNNSSKDAQSVAPCFSVAGKSFDKNIFADIVLAVSVFLCLLAVLSLIGIIGLIILNIIIIGRTFLKKRALNITT